VSQQPIPVVYENVRIDTGFKADLVIEDKAIFEIKSVELIAPVHEKQLLTYLRLADQRLGWQDALPVRKESTNRRRQSQPMNSTSTRLGIRPASQPRSNSFWAALGITSPASTV